MSIPKTPMTVVRLEVDSFKRLRAARVTPHATGLVPVRGKNAAGKSSLIEAMLAALLGKKAAPELPITEGEHGAQVVLDLGEIVVRRRWKRDSGGKATSSLTVEDNTGGRITSPQAILDALVGRFADPIAFLTQKPDEQVKTVLGILGLDAQLRSLEDEARRLYEERRDVGRDADRLSKAEEALEVEVEGLPEPPAGEPPQKVREQLAEAVAWNEKIDRLENDRASAEAQGKDVAEQIQALEEKLVALRAKKDLLTQKWKQANAGLRGSERIDVQPLLDGLKLHEEAAKHAARRELLDRTRQEAVQARAIRAEADEALQVTRTQIAELLGGAQFPIEGMAYDHEAKSLTIGGIPFSQASQAERLKAAAAVAMAGDPLIRVMFAREGSLLDDESRAQLAALAEERGFQFWLEVVDNHPEGAGVWIEDGEAFQSES